MTLEEGGYELGGNERTPSPDSDSLYGKPDTLLVVRPSSRAMSSSSSSSTARLPLLNTSSVLFSLDDDDDDSTPTAREPLQSASRPPLSTRSSDGVRGGQTLAPYSDDASEGWNGEAGEAVELRSVSPAYGMRSTVQSRELGASLAPLLPSFSLALWLMPFFYRP